MTLRSAVLRAAARPPIAAPISTTPCARWPRCPLLAAALPTVHEEVGREEDGGTAVSGATKAGATSGASRPRPSCVILLDAATRRSWSATGHVDATVAGTIAARGGPLDPLLLPPLRVQGPAPVRALPPRRRRGGGPPARQGRRGAGSSTTPRSTPGSTRFASGTIGSGRPGWRCSDRPVRCGPRATRQERAMPPSCCWHRSRPCSSRGRLTGRFRWPIRRPTFPGSVGGLGGSWA